MKALYTKITSTAPINGADKIQLATIQGYTVIVGVDTKPDTHGLFIQEGSQLSEAFALKHGLLATHPETGEPLGGYLRSNRKVSTLTLRGAKSYGIFIPMELRGLSIGDEIDTIENVQFVCRYETPAQQRIKLQNKSQPLARTAKVLRFPEHYDTPQLARSASGLVGADKIVITEKLHGTSGRTGWADVVIQYGTIKRWLSRRFPGVFGRWLPQTKPEIVTGSRRQNFAHRQSGDEYRNIVHAALAPLIEPGEIWYYEIVGFTTTGAAIMPAHGKMKWSYGCRPDGAGLGEQFKVYVYRITKGGHISSGKNWTADFVPIELGYDQIAQRIREAHRDAMENGKSAHWLAPVPKLGELHGSFTPELLIGFVVDDYENGKSTLDRSHIREGVCLRGESPLGEATTHAQKRKSHAFLTGEGKLAEDDNAVDPEDIA